MSNSRPHIVFVHGAWHGGWSWGETPDILAQSGYDVTVVDQLPSTQGQPTAGLREDADELRAIVERAPGPVLLVAHSYGGMVVSELAGDPKVAGVVYVAAFIPRPGATMLDLVGGRLPSWTRVDESGALCEIDSDVAIQLMASNAPSEKDASAHVARIVPQSIAAFETASSTKGWGKTPISYLLTTQDEVLRPEYQLAMAQGAGAVLTEVDAPHFPTLSKPHEVAEYIAGVAAAG